MNSLYKKDISMESSVKTRIMYPEFLRYKSMLSTRLSETSVFLPTKERIKIQKRLYPGQDIILSLEKMKPRHAVLLLGKYFETVPMENLIRDDVFLHYHQQLSSENPVGFSKTFNLGLQMAYRKKVYNVDSLQSTLSSKNISFIDPFNTTQSTQVDIYTVVSGFQGDKLASMTPFGNSTIEIVTNPRNNNKILHPLLLDRIIQSKKVTSNTVNDVDIDGHLYDFKHIEHVSYSKNHVYFYDIENIESAVKEHFKHIMKVIVYEKTKVNSTKAYQEYVDHCYIKLQNIIVEKATEAQKLEAWNLFLQQTMHKRPIQFTTPILVPSTTKPYTPTSSEIEDIKKIYIQHGHISDVKIFNALKNYVLNSTKDIQHAAFLSTKGVFDDNDSSNTNWTDVD